MATAKAMAAADNGWVTTVLVIESLNAMIDDQQKRLTASATAFRTSFSSAHMTLLPSRPHLPATPVDWVNDFRGFLLTS